MRRQQRQSSAATISASSRSAPGDALAFLSDDFEGTPATATARGFSLYDPSGSLASEAVVGGELDFTISAGGAGGWFWFNNFDGGLLHKTMPLPSFDARLRTRIRNTADTANPVVGLFRIAGFGLHDLSAEPGTYNYSHIGGGTDPSVVGIETKDTVNNASVFRVDAWTGTDLDPDLRIVRRATNPDLIDLFWRESVVAADLLDDNGWILHDTFDRSTQPFPATTSVLGIMQYSQDTVHDIRQHVERFTVRETVL